MVFKKEKEVIVAEKIEENRYHIASVVGMERADLVYFLAKLLEQYHDNMGYRSVLLIDNSYSKDLFAIFNQHDLSQDYYKVNRVTVQQDLDYSEEYFDKFTYVIFYHGFNVDPEILKKSNLVVLQSDYMPANYNQLKHVLDGYDGDVQVVFRNWLSKKIKESFIEKEIGLDPSRIEMSSVVKANMSDDLAYFYASHNGNQKISSANLSDLFAETLRFLTEKLTGADEKTIQKLFKKAK